MKKKQLKDIFLNKEGEIAALRHSINLTHELMIMRQQFKWWQIRKKSNMDTTIINIFEAIRRLKPKNEKE